MTLSSNSTLSLAYAEETTYGVVPAATPKLLRVLDESLKFDTKTETSNEINPSRQVSGSTIVDSDVSGGFNFELSYREFDPIIEAIISGDFNTYGTGGVKAITGTIVKAANTLTGTSGDFSGLVVGQWFSISGSALSNDNVYRITANTGTEITVDTETPFAADEAAVALDVSSTRASISTSSTLKSFSIEKEFGDVGQFFMFTGETPKSMSLDISAGSILKGSFDFIGKGSTRDTSTQFPGGAPSASQSYGIVNTSTGVGARAGTGTIFVEDSSGASLVSSSYVMSMKVDIDSGVRAQKAVGNLGNVGVGKGTFSVSGTIDVYLADGTIYDEAIANNTVTITFPIKDAAGNGYALTFQNVKIGVPPVNAGSKDSDTVMNIPFTAIAPNTTTDKMLVIDRFGAAVV